MLSLQAAYTNKTNVPADLQSAGIEYKDFSIRLLPIFLLIGMFSDHKLASLTVGSDTLCCRIAYPPEH